MRRGEESQQLGAAATHRGATPWMPQTAVLWAPFSFRVAAHFNKSPTRAANAAVDGAGTGQGMPGRRQQADSEPDLESEPEPGPGQEPRAQ